MGKANRFLSGHVDRIAAGLPNLNVPPPLRGKVVVTGNPVRPAVLEAAKVPYPDFEDGAFRLLVTGGSQGARVMADIVPEAIAALPEPLRARIRLVQQTRAEDMQRVEAIYQGAGVNVEIAPFFKDLPQRIAQAHFVISRSGASTVSELAVIGRPALFVPLPQSLDGDQAANAAFIEQAGGAETVKQSDFSPAFLTARLAALIGSPHELASRAEAAKRVGVADAAERLADLILSVAQGRAS
jgi:UDP-N-acetylglucosamine--N-acetylmuramyl-(pentapeptide) pyrophosphoryl-undecaprenol N-acetylglucosamine transferase